MTEAEKDIQEFSWSERRKTLRKLRKKAGLTLARLAGLAGLSRSMISKFELGQRDLSADAFSRLQNAIVEALADQKYKAAKQELSQKRDAANLDSLAGKLVPLSSLQHASLEEYRVSQELLPEDVRIALRMGSDLRKAQRRIRQLEELHASDVERIEGYRKLHETDSQIIKLLQETGPGSVAMEGVKALEELEKLRAENAELRSWLNAEEVAAVAHARAAELREQVTEKVKVEPTGEGE